MLSADEIYQKLLQTGATLNFSTVYRILESFTEKKLTEKVLLPQSRKYGFLLYTLSHTHHLICLGCHKVVNIDGCPLHGFEEDLAQKTHFETWAIIWNCTDIVRNAGKRRCEKIIHSAFISLASAGFHRLVTRD